MTDVGSYSKMVERSNELIKQLELVGVSFDRAMGEIRDRAALDGSHGDNFPVKISMMLGHRYESDGLAFRHDARLSIGVDSEDEDGDDDAAAIVEASIIVQFKSKSALEPDDEAARALGQTYSHRVMYPYLRELVQTTLARLGVAGATLGLLKLPT
jgi:hypothetical protein